MSITTPAELEGLQRIGAIVRETLDALAEAVRPGISTAELDQVAQAVVTRRGARSAPRDEYRFPGTVLLSVNDEIVHGVPGARVLQDGDLISLDVTLSKDGFVADAARTVMVGQGSDAARRLARAAETAFDAAIAVARAGVKVNEIGRAVDAEVRRHGFSVVPDLCGHGVGRKIHEAPSVPNYFVRSQRDVLTEGLVITIEPIIAARSPKFRTAPDGWTLRTTDGGWAAHHEHTMMITTGEPLFLTA